MTRFWKTVLLITLIVPAMLLVGAFGWYATAQAPRATRDPVVRPQEFLELAAPEPLGGKLALTDVRSNVGDSRLEELRAKAALAEKRSIERANVLRERLKQSEGVGEAEVKKALRAELHVAVLEAFKARHDLHAAEVASLEKQAQAMKQKLVEREASAADIVDRRVEDLLNPDKQWIVEPPAANLPFRETTAIEPPTGNENKLLVRRSETSVTVEGQFDGNEEILMVIGDPNTTAAAKDVKELKLSTPVHKAGEYVIEVRQDVVKIDGGGMVPGLVFQVHNVPNTVQGTSNISFTDKDPLPNGKVVIASPKTKLLLKRKTDQVIVTVGHVELPDALTVVPINIVIRRRARTDQPVPLKPQNKLPDDKADDSQSDARSENGQTKIVAGKIHYSVPFSFPSVEAILSHVPEGKARPKHERIECELVKYQVSEARHYPLVGPAQLVRTRFKSTITSEAGREVVYSDTSHLIRVLTE
ncbi:MAG: hypothetical protein ACKV2Q_13400 [Planctomycetaceae bacterium]